MRDPNRIHKVIQYIEKLWETVPDWRFMQLICNLQSFCGSDMFYMEEDRFLEHLNNFIENGV
jgi:hypothetical protein